MGSIGSLRRRLQLSRRIVEQQYLFGLEGIYVTWQVQIELVLSDLFLLDQGEVAPCFVFTAANAQQVGGRLPQVGDLTLGGQLDLLLAGIPLFLLLA